MTETWFEIRDFPGYEISDHGNIQHNGKLIQASPTKDGTLKVNLRSEGRTFTRSVKVLVADAFVQNPHPDVMAEFGIENVLYHPRRRPNWDVAIQIDGDQNNLHFSNLAWRPRWFAWKYARQFNNLIPDRYNVRVYNDRTQFIYESVMEAGVADGVLWEDVYSSCVIGKTTFPTGDTYSFVR